MAETVPSRSRRAGRAPPDISSDASTATLAPSGDPVLNVRFASPPVPQTFVRRPRLSAQLADGVRRPLVLVSGPTGAGKTLLVADWLSEHPVPWPTAWLNVERGDNAPGMFWAYMLAALRHHGVPLPDTIGSPGRADDVDESLLTRLAAHLSERPRPVLLVLDEFERATSPQVAAELDFVLRHAGGGLRLVLTSRTEPLLPLHRYRAADEMTEIRGADLAFTPQETAVLLDRHHLPGSAEMASQLTDRTEGWAAGLRLFALAIRQTGDADSFLRDFEAGHSTVADFLLAEVLATQPPQTQDLLLRTSILEQTHPDLANALTGRDDAEWILASLQRANAFVSPVGGKWYRYHPLFAEILRAHLRARHPGFEPELHSVAARWLCDAGQLSAALPHAAAAGDWEFAATEFVHHLAIGQLFTGLDATRLSALFAGMTPETSGTAPELVRAARDFAQYDIGGGLAHLHSAERNLANDETERDGADGTNSTCDDALNTHSERLSHAFLRVIAGQLLGSADMAETGAADAEHLQHAVSAERLAEHPELPALLLTGLGSAELWAGRLDAARTALVAAVEASRPPDTAFPQHESLGRIALIDFLHGWLRRAQTRAREAVAEADRAGIPPTRTSGIAHMVLAAIAIDQHDLPAARDALVRTAQSSGADTDPVVAAGLTILRSRLLLATGDAPAALDALSGHNGRLSADGLRSPWVSARLALAECAAHLAQGHIDAAQRALHDADPDTPEYAVAAARAHAEGGQHEVALRVLDTVTAEPGAGPAVTVRARLVRAQVAHALGDEAAARNHTARAISMARPELLRRPFVEAGPWLLRILRHWPALAEDWLVPSLFPGEMPASPPVPQAAPTEPLSKREHDVLEHAALAMSAEEIAEQLHVSINTVKTHLKNVYRKLAVNRRSEAIRRARALGLL